MPGVVDGAAIDDDCEVGASDFRVLVLGEADGAAVVVVCEEGVSEDCGPALGVVDGTPRVSDGKEGAGEIIVSVDGTDVDWETGACET